VGGGSYSSKASDMASKETEFVKTRKGEFHTIVYFSDQDRIGCLLERVEVRPLHDTRLLVDPSLVSKALTQLDGGLAVVEAEGPGHRAVLKSALPRTVGSTIQFFEMVIDPRSGMVLRRCVFDYGSGERGTVPFAMTRENLDRLVGDLKKLL
jgi:hypothetical protein